MTTLDTTTRAEARLFAAGPAAIGALLRGEPQAAEVLGAFPTAVYLRLAAGQVLAVLTRDAVRLPLGLVLPVDSSRHPLDRWAGPVTVGGGVVRTSACSVRMSRTIPTVAPSGLRPDAELVAHAATWLRRRAEDLPRAERLVAASRRRDAARSTAAARELLGAGPGLTPAGDDVLAGFLVGARAYGVRVDLVREAVLGSAATRTTALSAALLACAARGESVPQVTALLHATGTGATGPSLEEALADLARVGHTSGVAMGLGVVAAAEMDAVACPSGRRAALPGDGEPGQARP
jgi:hypothetical protein